MLDAARRCLPDPTQSRWPVIARFVMLDGSEEWRPAMQVRHVDGLMLVRVGATTYQQEYTWLAEDDVTTAIRPRQV